MMAAADLHVIRRQSLELTIAGPDQVHALQETVRRLYHQRLVPVLEAVFADWAGADEVIRLERLELDLGSLSPAELEAELPERLRSALQTALAEQIGALRNLPAGHERGRVIQPLTSRLELLGHFLQTGTAPWWTARAAELDGETLLAQLLDGAPDTVAALLRRIAHPRIAKRLVKQFSPALQSRLIAALAPTQTTAFERAGEDWIALLSAEFEAASMTHSAVDFVRVQRFLYLSTANTPAHPDGLAAHLIQAVADLPAQPLPLTRARLARRADAVLSIDSPLRRWFATADFDFADDASAGFDTARDTHKPEADRPLAATEQPDSTLRPADERSTPAASHAEDAGHAAVSSSGATEFANNAASRKSSQAKPASPDAENARAPFASTRAESSPLARDARNARDTASTTRDRLEKRSSDHAFAPHAAEVDYLIDNAGLVLIWPFLSRFFATLGLIEQRAFTSPAAQERAVLLLQYLATGDSACAEHRLLLNKLLCGWPLDEPVVNALELTPMESQESTVLLESAIMHWRILKKTSVAGLRASFFQREGKLNHQEQSWRLQVPRVGYDVLLDKLPWGTRLIRLAWMPEPLFVEW